MVKHQSFHIRRPSIGIVLLFILVAVVTVAVLHLNIIQQSAYHRNLNTVLFSNSSVTTTFTESGLPSGTKWSVSYDGKNDTNITTSLRFYTGSGTFFFSAGSPVSGGCKYNPSPASGNLSAGSSETITYSSSCTLTTTFTESGLPSGTKWSVSYDGRVLSSTKTSISFNNVSGPFSFTIYSIKGYVVSPSSGTASAGINLSIHFTKYPLTKFIEKGLPSSSEFTVTYDNIGNFTNSTSLDFDTAPGNYSFFISNFTKNGVNGSYIIYIPSPSKGVVSAGSTVNITFSQGKSSIENITNITKKATHVLILFDEAGLPVNSTWSITFGGRVYQSNSNYLEIVARASTNYSWTAQIGVYHDNFTYVPSTSFGTISTAINSTILLKYYLVNNSVAKTTNETVVFNKTNKVVNYTSPTKLLLSLSANRSTTAIISNYSNDPVKQEINISNLTVLGNYIDVKLNTTVGINNITIRFPLILNSSLKNPSIYWWNGHFWSKVSNFSRINNYLEFVATGKTIPSTVQFTGTLFAVGAVNVGIKPQTNSEQWLLYLSLALLIVFILFFVIRWKLKRIPPRSISVQDTQNNSYQPKN